MDEWPDSITIPYNLLALNSVLCWVKARHMIDICRLKIDAHVDNTSLTQSDLFYNPVSNDEYGTCPMPGTYPQLLWISGRSCGQLGLEDE